MRDARFKAGPVALQSAGTIRWRKVQIRSVKPRCGPRAQGRARVPQTIFTLRLGSRSMWHSMTSPRTTGPTFSGVPE